MITLWILLAFSLMLIWILIQKLYKKNIQIDKLDKESLKYYQQANDYKRKYLNLRNSWIK